MLFSIALKLDSRLGVLLPLEFFGDFLLFHSPGISDWKGGSHALHIPHLTSKPLFLHPILLSPVLWAIWLYHPLPLFIPIIYSPPEQTPPSLNTPATGTLHLLLPFSCPQSGWLHVYTQHHAFQFLASTTQAVLSCTSSHPTTSVAIPGLVIILNCSFLKSQIQELSGHSILYFLHQSKRFTLHLCFGIINMTDSSPHLCSLFMLLFWV